MKPLAGGAADRVLANGPELPSGKAVARRSPRHKVTRRALAGVAILVVAVAAGIAIANT